MSAMRCPTVKIDDGNGSFIVINEADFDKEIHNEFSEVKTIKEGSLSWLKQELGSVGIDIPEKAKKSDLEKLLEDYLVE